MSGSSNLQSNRSDTTIKRSWTSYLRKYRWPVGVLAISQPWGSGTSSGMIGGGATSVAWVERELTGREAGEEWARTWWGVREPHTPPSELAWRETFRLTTATGDKSQTQTSTKKKRCWMWNQRENTLCVKVVIPSVVFALKRWLVGFFAGFSLRLLATFSKKPSDGFMSSININIWVSYKSNR